MRLQLHHQPRAVPPQPPSPPLRPCRGAGAPGHHMLGRYALSLAAVIKAQARTDASWIRRLLAWGCFAWGEEGRKEGRRLPGRLAAACLLAVAPPSLASLPACPRAPSPRPSPLPPPMPLQFNAGKRLPGGEAGATALAQALDLGLALSVRHLDLASLQVPALLPQLAEAPAAPKVGRQGVGGGGTCRCGAPLGTEGIISQSLRQRCRSPLREGVRGSKLTTSPQLPVPRPV